MGRSMELAPDIPQWVRYYLWRWGIREAPVNLLLVIPWCAGGGRRSPWHPRIWRPTSPYTVSDVRAGYTPYACVLQCSKVGDLP